MGSQEGVSWASKFLDVLNNSGVPYLCCGGTLLGLARDGCIIEWDDDLDFWAPRLWFFSSDFLRFRESRIAEGYIVRFRGAPMFPTASFYRDGYKVSISSLVRVGRYNYNVSSRLPAEFLCLRDFARPVLYRAQGMKWRLPPSYEEILAFTYGDWRTPVRWLEGAENYASNSRNPKAVRVLLKISNLLLSALRIRNCSSLKHPTRPLLAARDGS